MSKRRGAYSYGSMARNAYRAGSALNRGRYLYTKLRHRYKGAGSMTQHKKRKSSGRGVTNQFDRRLIYKKSFMSRRKKGQWKSFVRKVQAAAERDLGSKTVVMNEQKSSNTINVENQAFFSASLYGIASSQDRHNDVSAIAANDGNIGTTGKFIFKSGVLDLTYRNTSEDANGNGAPVETDVYEIEASKAFTLLNGTVKDICQALTDGFADTGNIGGPVGLSLTDRGVTPFDCPQGLGQYGIRILKKTKYFLGSGQTFTYQIRDPKRHVFDKAWVTEQTAPNRRGLTRWVLFIQKTVPGTASGIAYINRLDIGITRKYLYKHQVDSSDADNYLL